MRRCCGCGGGGVCGVSRGWLFCQIAIENVEAIFSGSGPGSHQTDAHLSGRGAARPTRVLGHQSGGAPDAQWHGKGGGIRKFRPFFIAPHLRLAMAAIFSESKTRFARRHLACRSVFCLTSFAKRLVNKSKTLRTHWRLPRALRPNDFRGKSHIGPGRWVG